MESDSMEIDQGKPPFTEEEGKKEIKPIVLVLMGLPGSGKSTFCDEVMKISSRACLQFTQQSHWKCLLKCLNDTINKGKSGTKAQCLSSATCALKDGKSVIIDRCNIDKEQRADFLKFGGSHMEKHAVVLDLPSKLCISRSVKRTGHEGNLQGGRAAAVVNQMASKKELPKLSEGFNRITICQDEKDVKEAINVYGSLGPLDSLPSGCFGQKKTDTKIQVGIMKFLKEAEPPRTGSESTAQQKVIPNDSSIKKDSGLQGTKMDPLPSGDTLEKLEKGDGLDTTSTSGGAGADSIPTLAFPSISTADFQFNIEKASDIIVEKVEEFIHRIGEARLVLVDLSHGSKILSLVKTKAARKNLDSQKFFTFVGDITQLRSQRGLHCNVIANAANWRLKPGGGGVNAAIYSAAGPELEIATKEKVVTLMPGKSVVVPLPSSSPLFAKEGVTHVIHVLGPNMNPKRPDCLKDDYTQGCKILREAYSSLFEGFLSTFKSHGVSESGDIEEVISKNGDQKAKRGAVYELDNNKKSKELQKDSKLDVSNEIEEKKVEKTKAWAPWTQALHNIAMNPENHNNIVLEVSDDVVVINDAFPKAQKHILVIARVDGLDSIADVRLEHISLLKKMHDVGMKWAEKFIHENKSLLFRLGYHSVPSMRQLHLHVISQDFDSSHLKNKNDSSHLKNKKHWNSFNSPFFLDSVDVINELSLTSKNDKFLAMELRCHRCKSAHPNMPWLKSHITSCRAPFPARLLQNGRLVSSQELL